MYVSIRCCECRTVIRVAPQFAGRQKVCCDACRAERRRRQAKQRRQRDLEGTRQDDLRRQHRRRKKLREQRACGEAAAGDRHAPDEARNLAELRAKVSEIVDRALSLSRADLKRAVLRELREMKALAGSTSAKAWQCPGGCHAPVEVRSGGKDARDPSGSVGLCHAPGFSPAAQGAGIGPDGARDDNQVDRTG